MCFWRKKIRQEISSTELGKILHNEFGKSASVYLVDWNYRLVDKREMEVFLANDKTNLEKYVPEYHDCDDFSFRLMGQTSIPSWSDTAFGIVFAQTPEGGHAINCFVTNDKKVFLIEPQTDQVFLKPAAWQVFFCLM